LKRKGWTVKLYLETSVSNMLFSLQAREKRVITEKLFADIYSGVHQAFVSVLYLEEVGRTSSPLLRYQLEGVVKVYNVDVLEITEDVKRVADEYVRAEAFTEQNYADALHVAIAVCGDCEAVVSWNYRHIARVWTMKKVAEVNRRLGLSEIVICTPLEVIDYEDGSGPGR